MTQKPKKVRTAFIDIKPNKTEYKLPAMKELVSVAVNNYNHGVSDQKIILNPIPNQGLDKGIKVEYR